MRDCNKCEIRCIKCGKNFLVSACRKGIRKYCSRVCQNSRYEILCIKCNATFWVLGHKKDSAKYCSQSCRESGKQEIVCGNCGKKFTVTEYRKNTAKYCSRKCKNNLNALLLICKKCGKTFRRNKWKKKGDINYCSSKCYHNREAEIFVNCDGCDKRIRIFPSQQKYYNSHYCSNKCRIKFGAIGKLTDDICEKNAYQRFVRSVRHCSKYYEWRSVVRKRDNETCVLCGSVERITVHHRYVSMYDFIRKYGFNKEKIYGDLMFFDPKNGQTLCRRCHAKQHIKSRRN